MQPTLTGVLPWRPNPRNHNRPPNLNQSPWVVIHDPSGDFLWRRFRVIDLAQEFSNCWPEGIIFWNAMGGEVRIWQEGRYRTLRPGRAA